MILMLPLAGAVTAAPGDRLIAVYRVHPAGDQGIAAEGLVALQQALQQRLCNFKSDEVVVAV